MMRATANRVALSALSLAALVLSWGWAAAADESRADWPGWRGKDRTALTKEAGLLKEWPKSGPKLLWSFEAAGFGYGQPAIVDDELFILGMDDDGEFIKKLSAEGKEVGRAKLDHSDYKYLTGWGGGPRSTPTVDGDSVYALSSNGRLACYDRSSLREKWSKSLVEDFGGGVPKWGYAESPLVDGDKLLVTPGGENLVVALNKSGDTVWKSTGLGEGAQYSSLVPMSVGGKKMYVNQAEKSLFGVDPDNGKVLWKFGEIARRTAVIPTPIVSGSRAYATSGYGAGCECVEVEGSGDAFEAKKVYVNRNMGNHHGGVILVGEHIYGHSSMQGRAPWVCQKLSDGSVASKFEGAGKGSIAHADGRFYLYEERIGGSVVLVEASPDGWKEHGRFKLPKNSSLKRGQGQIWAHPVVVGGKLYLRDLDLLYCYDVKAR